MDVRGTKLTYAGLTALAKANAGEELRFTRVVMGDGELLPDTDIREMEDVINITLNLPILEVKVTGVGTSVIESRLQNMNLTQGFWAKEVGIYAVVNPTEAEKQSGNYANEILYAYRNTGRESEYIPAGGTSEVWDIIYDVIAVIDNAENITADVSGDLAYVTRPDFQEHIDSTNPHPNIPQLMPEVAEADMFWVSNNDKNLHPMSIKNARLKIMGSPEWTIPRIVSRIDRIEHTQANMLLSEELNENFPDLNYGIVEQFTDMDTVDTFKVKVTSAVKGDDSIDVETIKGIIIGRNYTLSDEVRTQKVTIRSIARESGILRVILNEVVAESFNLGRLYMMRTTANIKDGVVTGNADIHFIEFKPNERFTPPVVGQEYTSTHHFSGENKNLYTTLGDIVFLPDGGVTLGGVD